ncbi:MAG TPA: SDR family oxidoreductase [Dehalococcoidia bacterium]|nr:SDR family oxidoreductase [Dehalococcoidia bacterium]
MRIIVTGHGGFIGTHAVEQLIEAGHFVKGIDLNLYAGCDFYSMCQPPISQHRDVFDLTPEDFEGFDAVFHLAGLSNDPLCELDESLTWRINHEGTLHAARCAKEAGVPRFLLASSCSIYGKSGDKILGETDELSPITVYADSKIASEVALAEMADNNFSPVFLRNATAYGTSPRLRLDLVVNNLTAWAFSTGEIMIMSDGTPWRPLVHCRDIARAFIHLAEAPRELIHNQAYNIGRTEENYRVRDVAAIVAEEMPSCTIRYAVNASPDSRDYRVDFSKFAKAFPEFTFTSTVRDGVRELLGDYQRFGMTLERMEGHEFNRLRALQKNSMHLVTTPLR